MSLPGSSSPWITGRQVCDFYSKVHFFPGFVQPILPQASLSSAGAWRKRTHPRQPKSHYIYPHRYLMHFVSSSCYAQHFTIHWLLHCSGQRGTLILDMNHVLQDVTRSMWWNWGKTWEAAKPGRTYAEVLLKKSFQFRRNLQILPVSLPVQFWCYTFLLFFSYMLLPSSITKLSWPPNCNGNFCPHTPKLSQGNKKVYAPSLEFIF